MILYLRNRYRAGSLRLCWCSSQIHGWFESSEGRLNLNL
jgi:hypothetical protein